MKAMKAVLGDRKRAQRGGVLSGVLIMVAFLAILSGAVMTELSTHFLISRALVNRVAVEATVNSAMELALDQLQHSALMSGCPGVPPNAQGPPTATVNGRTAAVSYVSCWPTVDVGSRTFPPIASSSPFSIDATHSTIPAMGRDLYLAGASGGWIYQYMWGGSLNWSLNLNSTITGPPLAMQDAAANPPDTGTPSGSGNNADIANLVPIVGGGSSGCSAAFCVELLGEDTGPAPDVFCFMAANARVTSRPAAGIGVPQVAYFGDTGGTLYAYTATEFCPGGTAARQASLATPGNVPIVAGPIVVQNGGSDEIYVVTFDTSSDNGTSQLLHFTFRQSPTSLTLTNTLTLPFSGSTPVGLAPENTGVAPRIAINFANGGVAIVSTNSNYVPSLTAAAGVGVGTADAPYWCSCPTGPQIGVSGVNGQLFVLDTNLTLVASSAAGSPVHTTPASDGLGEWFFGADDGRLYEVQQRPGQSVLAQVAQYGPLGGGGQIGSSALAGPCPAGICIYLGSMNSNAYMVPLDARDGVLTACLSKSPPACSSDNPRLWAQVEVGVAGNPQAVHVQGWSYYSP